MAYYGDNEVLFSPTVNTTVDLTMEIDENSTNDECPSAKAVYDFGQFINSGSDPIVNVKTGEVITTNDSGLKPLHALNLYGKTTQAGTPTPDAPIDLVSVGESGAFEIGLFAENLLEVTQGTKTSVGVKFTLNEDKSYTLSGTCTNNVVHHIGKAYFVKGTQYKVTGCPIGGASNTYLIRVIGSNNVMIAEDVGGGKTFTATETGFHIIGIRVQNGINTNGLNFYPMIKYASETNGNYEPCNKQTLEVPYTLYGIPVSSGGNYTDANGQQWICDEVDFENAYEIQRIKKIVLNGSETYTLNANGVIQGALSGVVGNWAKYFAFSTHFIYSAEKVNSNTEAGYFAIDSGGGVYFTTEFTTVADFKAWLQNNPVTIYGVLAKPQFYSFQYSAGVGGMYCPLIDAYEALHTNKPNTTIISADNAGQRVAYVADPKLYIDNKFTELENAILSLGGNI